MLNIKQIKQIGDKINAIQFDEWIHILITLNRQEELNHFLDMINHRELSPDYRQCEFLGNGLIVVIGDSIISKQEIEEILEENGINKNRLELVNDFKDIKKYNFQKMKFQTMKYAAVLVGPIPHKTKGLKKYPSMISQMEKEDGYPPTRKLMDSHNELIITKKTFSDAIMEKIEKRVILPS